MPKLCPKIILEGTRLTLKTEIAWSAGRYLGQQRHRGS